MRLHNISSEHYEIIRENLNKALLLRYNTIGFTQLKNFERHFINQFLVISF